MDEPEHHMGRRSDDISWQLVDQRLDGFEREMRSRFESMEQLLNQRIRHGDKTTEASVKMFADIVSRVDKRSDSNADRIQKLENQQLTWKSNLRLLSVIIGGSTGAGGIAGTIIGLTIGA